MHQKNPRIRGFFYCLTHHGLCPTDRKMPYSLSMACVFTDHDDFRCGLQNTYRGKGITLYIYVL